MAAFELSYSPNIYSIFISFYTALNKGNIYSLCSILSSEEHSICELLTVTTVITETVDMLTVSCYNCDYRTAR